MNRIDLQCLAEERLRDAEVLLAASRWAGAYYLLGYAVKCALKACAARNFREHEVPDKKLVEQFYVHNFEKLVRISGVKFDLENRVKTDAEFESAWKTVGTWNERARYDHTTTEKTAHDMHEAVVSTSHGVLPWLKSTW